MRGYEMTLKWRQEFETEEEAKEAMNAITLQFADKPIMVVATDIVILPRGQWARAVLDEMNTSSHTPPSERLGVDPAGREMLVAAVDEETGQPIAGEIMEATDEP